MDQTLRIRSPLKVINSDGSITPSSKKNYKLSKRRKLSMKNEPDSQKTILDFYKIDIACDQKINETSLLPDNAGEEINECNQSLTCDIGTGKYTVLKANKFFMEDLRCPKLSPFSQINYSCSSVRSCEYENHKIVAEKISETQEKALSFLAKSWYMLKYPLTCLISDRIYLSPFILRFLFYGILNEKDETICLRIKDIIKGHLELHSPCNRKLRDLYHDTLVGDIDNLDPSNPDIVSCNFTNILKSIENLVTELNTNQHNKLTNEIKVEDIDKTIRNIPVPEDIDGFYQFFSDNYLKTGSILPPSLITSNHNVEEEKDEINTEGLLKRHFMVFSLMVDILEENFRMWWMRSRYFLKKKLHSTKSCPIIATVAWDTNIERGLLNDHCIRVFEVFKSCPQEYQLEIARYISLLSEVVRASEDNIEKKFPFFGENCNLFAKELSSYVIIENGENIKQTSIIQLIHPSWLRFKICGYVLKSEITSGGVDDLDSILKILQRNLSPWPNTNLRKGGQGIVKCNVKYNKTDTSGETVIHKYCRTNNHKALSTALRSKETNVNIADNAGWTPLHNAAKYNSVDCLKLLIKHRSTTVGGTAKLNMFPVNSDNDTPLACAVKEGNEMIVHILLSNGAGVTVWNTVSSGLSVVDHAHNKDLKEILVKEWKKATSLYRNLNMNPTEVELVYYMISSYCNVYHIGKRCVKLEPELCKRDSHYDFDYSQFYKDERKLIDFFYLIEKLCTFRSNPKNLKNLRCYLKLRVESL